MSESVNATAAEIKNAWIADGTAHAEPVTVETPAAPTVETPRNEAGQFASTAPAEAEIVETAAANAATAAVLDMLEAKLGEATVQIPKSALIPLKRGEVVEHVTIEELQKRGMLELDYRHKTADLGAQRRDVEAQRAQVEADRARQQAREQWLAEQDTQMREAQKDPQKWEAYQEMLRQYETNPLFRQRMDDALAKRETDAELAVYKARDFQAQVQQGTDLAAGWVEQIGQEFPAVPTARIRTLYAQALSVGTAKLDPADVRALYQQEASYLTQSATPLQTQLAELQAQVTALHAKQAAEKLNATTTHALDRAKAAPVTTTTRAPSPVAAATTAPFGPRDLADRNAQWARQR